MAKTTPRTSPIEWFRLLNIRISDLFRISIFGFRIYPLYKSAINGRAGALLTIQSFNRHPFHSP